MTEPITSRSNPHLKELRKLQDRKHRDRTGLFVAEGEDMLAAALNHGHVPDTVYFDSSVSPVLPDDVERVPVDRDVLASASSLGSFAFSMNPRSSTCRFTSSARPSRKRGELKPVRTSRVDTPRWFSRATAR